MLRHALQERGRLLGGKIVRYADANVIKIKHDVLEAVARLAFAGELEERKDEIPLKLIPGPTAQFRCCIYKEREIIRQRVRLAEGKAPGSLMTEM